MNLPDNIETHCPRCGSEWEPEATAKDEVNLQCLKACGMLKRTADSFALQLDTAKPVDGLEIGPTLYWVTESWDRTRGLWAPDEHCLYRKGFALKATRLPWLPFDVTEESIRNLLERIRKLVAFS